MTPERWREVSRIYHLALADQTARRQVRVMEACRDDPALAREVLSLLAHSPDEPFLELSPDEGEDDENRPGWKLGSLEILGVLGRGGMGQVYRARDPKLGREVAVKILSPAFTIDADRLARFEREARLLAALNHPHVGSIFGIEEAEGLRGLVLELVDGETLAERLARGPLPLAEALNLADQIADGLEAAHEKGIVHRDLKPANLMVRPDGTLKILDFGLGKLNRPAAPASSETTPALSVQGMVLGTPAYMSPEQARGLAVDRRTDVWSFGCVLLEMLTGAPAFARETTSDTIAAVLTDEPDYSGLPPETPAGLRRLLQRCLAKDPRRRLRDLGDARLEIADLPGNDQAVPVLADGTTRRFSTTRWFPALMAVSLLAAGAALWWTLARSDAAPPPDARPESLVRLTYDDGYVEGPAVSPDGRLVAYASDRAGADNLDIWVQHVAGGDPIQVTSDDADERQPAFSPDGGHIVFRSEDGVGALFTVPALGGVPRLVARGAIQGARFSPDGRHLAYWTGSAIGFTPMAGSYRTFIIPAAGGTPAEVSGFTGVRYPAWSPDGRHLMLAASRAAVPDQESYDWWVVQPETAAAFETGVAAAFRKERPVGALPGPAHWMPGRILASMGGQLWSAEIGPAPGFGIGRLQRLTFGHGEASEPAASPEGLVAFVGGASIQNGWALPIEAETGRVRGEPRQVTEGIGPNGRVSASADGRLLAYQSFRGSWTVLVQDTTTGRVTNLAVSARQFGPVISPDGSKVAYPAADGGVNVVATEGGPSRRVCDDCEAGDWTLDGRALATTQRRQGRPRILLVDDPSGRSVPLLGDATITNRPHLSPDNRWLAFRSGETEQGAEVFVAPFRPHQPVPRSEWVRVNDLRERDARPAGWSPGGRMLYFLSSRDGFRCLYALPWDGGTGRPGGDVQLVRHFHNFRNPGGGGASVISTGAGNAILANSFLFDYSSTKSSIWTMRLLTRPGS